LKKPSAAIMALAAAVMITAHAACNILTEDPTDVVKRYISSIKMGNYDDAYELLSKEFKMVVNKELFISAAQTYRDMPMEVIGKAKINGDIAIVTIKGIFTEEQKLIKEGGKWRLMPRKMP
jgi:hypothetical protein